LVKNGRGGDLKKKRGFFWSVILIFKVTLLIGVNNQYQGKPIEDFKEFSELLKRPLALASGIQKM